MIPHKQMVRHDPPNTYGDCVRTCIASILNIENVADVPHFHFDNPGDDEARERIADYLRVFHSLVMIGMVFPGMIERAEVMNTMTTTNPDVHYLLAGATSDGNPHMIVCRNGEVVNNPAWYPGNDVVLPNVESGYWIIILFAPDVLI